MTTPAGTYKNYNYKTLSTYEVDNLDNFTGFPKQIKLSNFLDSAKSTGHIASAKLVFSVQPTATDTEPADATNS
jgi:hypothetical protein